VSRASTVSQHPERAAIEAALARGMALRKIAKRYGVSLDAAFRHRKKMRREQPELFQALAASDWRVKPEELEKLRVETSDGYLKILRSQVAKLIAAQDRCIEDGIDAQAASLAGQANRALELVGKAIGQIGAAGSITVTNNNAIILNAGFWELRTKLIRALAPYPEARSAVLEALREAAFDGSEETSRPMIVTVPVQAGAYA
jgi:transposase-like protein